MRLRRRCIGIGLAIATALLPGGSVLGAQRAPHHAPQSYAASLQKELMRRTAWVCRARTDEALRSRVRTFLSDILREKFNKGELRGWTAEEAFFVHCDRATVTQNNIDNGGLSCVVGVAPVYPAEFVVIKIGQWACQNSLNQD